MPFNSLSNNSLNTSTAWTVEQTKLFENALAIYDDGTPNSLEKIGKAIEDKIVQEVRQRYQLLAHKIKLVPLPNYRYNEKGIKIVKDPNHRQNYIFFSISPSFQSLSEASINHPSIPSLQNFQVIPYPTSMASNPLTSFQNNNSSNILSTWTAKQNKLFENALEGEVKLHYQLLVQDIQLIGVDFVSLPNYRDNKERPRKRQGSRRKDQEPEYLC